MFTTYWFIAALHVTIMDVDSSESLVKEESHVPAPVATVIPNPSVPVRPVADNPPDVVEYYPLHNDVRSL